MRRTPLLGFDTLRLEGALGLPPPANRAIWYGHARNFWREYGRKARAGIRLQTGRTVEWHTPDVLAVPWWRVL